MTTDHSPDIPDTADIDDAPLEMPAPLSQIDALLDQIAEMDPAEAVEPLAQITSLLNTALDSAQERL